MRSLPVPDDVLDKLKGLPACMITGLPLRIVDRIKQPFSICGCWEITSGWTSGDGYAKMQVCGRGFVVHKLTYVLCVGPVAAGNVIHHLCNNRACCNPFHLVETSIRYNVYAGKAILYGSSV